MKKIIKHLTCRRATRGAKQGKGARTRASAASWKDSFTVGFVEQAFKRAVVEHDIRHGEENAPYLLREDITLREQGLTGVKKERKDRLTRASGDVPTIVEALS